MLVALPLVDETRPFHKGTEVVQCDAPIYLQECPLDDVLQLDRAEGARAGEREQMSPGFRGESTTLVRTQYSKRHYDDRRSANTIRRKERPLRAASILFGMDRKGASGKGEPRIETNPSQRELLAATVVSLRARPAPLYSQ